MKRGKIILTPFPFTDLQGKKVRPALIVSSDKRPGNDVIIIFISSVISSQNKRQTDIVINKDEEAFPESGLKVTSVIKADKLATISRDVVLGELGELTDEKLNEVELKLKIALDLNGPE